MRQIITSFLVLFFFTSAFSPDLQPGKTTVIEFSSEQLPETLYNMFTGLKYPPAMSVHLPAGYSLEKRYPVLLYVPGHHGNKAGNIANAVTLGKGKEWIAISLPLFKSRLDKSEFGGGLAIGHEDYPVLSRAYTIMLDKFRQLVPNSTPEGSSIVGFSNGAQAIAVLVSHHDDCILSMFENFVLVDHGMFHLTDLHKSKARDKRYLLLLGEKDEPGRQLKIDQTKLLLQAWGMVKIDMEAYLQRDVGHVFNTSHMNFVTSWLTGEFKPGQAADHPVVKPLQ